MGGMERLRGVVEGVGRFLKKVDCSIPSRRRVVVMRVACAVIRPPAVRLGASTLGGTRLRRTTLRSFHAAAVGRRLHVRAEVRPVHTQQRAGLASDSSTWPVIHRFDPGWLRCLARRDCVAVIVCI